jgi:hypothetical protein
MRQEHRAGEKLFVDYSGNKPRLMDAMTGERMEVELFVAVLGASNYMYAEATRTQRGPDFIASHQRCLVYLGGVARCWCPTSSMLPRRLVDGDLDRLVVGISEDARARVTVVDGALADVSSGRARPARASWGGGSWRSARRKARHAPTLPAW